jgi:hypothetical protein
MTLPTPRLTPEEKHHSEQSRLPANDPRKIDPNHRPASGPPLIVPAPARRVETPADLEKAHIAPTKPQK